MMAMVVLWTYKHNTDSSVVNYLNHSTICSFHTVLIYTIMGILINILDTAYLAEIHRDT